MCFKGIQEHEHTTCLALRSRTRVEGETIVRRIVEHHDSPDLSAIDLPLIPKILFRNDASLKVLCNVQKGRVDLAAGRDF